MRQWLELFNLFASIIYCHGKSMFIVCRCMGAMLYLFATAKMRVVEMLLLSLGG